MGNPLDMIARLQDFAVFLSGLATRDTSVWAEPLDEGKWSIHDIISHIMMWDRHFVDEVVPGLHGNGHVTLAESADPEKFNARAVAYGRTLSHEKLLDEALHCRSELVSQLRTLPHEAFEMTPRDGNSMTLSAFLERMFVSHDRHHMQQIESYLARRRHRPEPL